MNDTFEKFKDLSVLVIGDVMLDRYYFTDVSRISPEAPIPVARYSYKKDLLGGAANVALNVSKLGSKTYLIGRIGIGENGVAFRKLVESEKIEFYPILSKFKTITKIRIVSRGSQIARLDFEDKINPDDMNCENIIDEIEKIIDKIDIIIISDYQKGMIGKKLINYFSCLKKHICIDTKPGGFIDYRGFSLIKPNFSEAVEIARELGCKEQFTNNDESAKELGDFLRNTLKSNILMTRSGKGVTYTDEDNTYHAKTDMSEVIDVTGASDTSIAIFSLLDYLKIDRNLSLKILNAAAKVTISHFGNYAPQIYEIKRNLNTNELVNIIDYNDLDNVLDNLRKQKKKIVFTNGCFDILHKGHIIGLNKAKELGDILIVGLNSDTSVKTIKGEQRPINNQDSRAILLSNLKPVDYVVIFNESTPINLIEKIKPDVHVKGGDYKKDDMPETKTVEKYGGRVEIIDLIGYNLSTTNIINKIKGLKDGKKN